MRKRSGIKAKFNRTFVVREDKELERVFARPLKTFYGREHNMKEFELYDNTDELVEGKTTPLEQSVSTDDTNAK